MQEFYVRLEWIRDMEKAQSGLAAPGGCVGTGRRHYLLNSNPKTQNAKLESELQAIKSRIHEKGIRA